MFFYDALAIGSAVCIAASSMFVNELNGRVPLMRLARWQLTAAFVLTALAATFAGGWVTLELWQVKALIGSSLAGIVIASTTYFAAIFTAGPRVTALLFSLASPFALLLGYLALGETITPVQGAGVILILAGIAIAIGMRRRRPAPMIPLVDARPIEAPAPPTPPISLLGIAFGIITALGQAVGSLLARPAMASGVEPFAAMAVRAGFAVLVFWALLVLPRMRRDTDRLVARDLGLAVTAAFFGTALGMSLLMAALSGGNVGIVSTLSSMTPIVILPMVWLRSGQRPRARAWGGAALAILGTALISLN
ncbi:DMT family transporter [Rhizobium halophytocola]|uniref:Drug/metabolite transporter (DMT)-like permease n=1 Tax=Rhizobium halophytocola TaxID=735519 RepID=A0ABS4DZG9_9HYPH|nr:DMT family transporter [Rhizobium halophytocola]MBP1851082.1 drug/metabolite transporter (DMT)-like permease [Rhizobium halophytocola]